MIRTATRLLGAAVAMALAGCASAPMHYYTLMAPAAESADEPMPPAAESAGASTAAADQGAAGLPFELLPVSVPAQVDVPQLVVREGGQGVAMLEGRRWIAPLGSELRGALSADLARQLHSQDVSGLPGNQQPLLRIKLELHRFDSQLGGYALIEAGWSVHVLHAAHGGTLACSSRVREAVGPGYDALVQGHQRALAQLAAQIAGAARALGRDEVPTCPAS